MLLIRNGYCVEAGQNGWSKPVESEVSHMGDLDPRNLIEVENHSGQAEVVFESIGAVAITNT